jgi:Bax protein
MPYLSLLFALIFFTACVDPQSTQIKKTKVDSIDQLTQFFDDLNYTSSNWKNRHTEVPRLYLAEIPKTWTTTSETLPVKEKKEIFFRLITPLVLMSNEAILQERQRLQKEPIDSEWIKKLALKYRVLSKEDTSLTADKLEKLKKRVDIIPPSLALAQAAEESGWGTSRFASEGNALFGQWDFSGKGMRPEEQRSELGDYGLARFDTPLDAVKGYMLNLNTTSAYTRLRGLRQDLRHKGKNIVGWELAKSLDRYSERGQAYIDGLHDMMSYNKLQPVDYASLSADPTIHLITVN